MPHVVVIGYGHRKQGDDEAGLLVAEGLEQDPPEGADVCKISGDAMSLIECWEFCETAIVVHAFDSGRMPGTIQRFDGREAVENLAGTLSAHSLALREALQLGKILGRMPKHFIVYAIEAHQFTTGAEMTPAVRDAVDVAVARIREECERIRSDAAGAS